MLKVIRFFAFAIIAAALSAFRVSAAYTDIIRTDTAVILSDERSFRLYGMDMPKPQTVNGTPVKYSDEYGTCLVTQYTGEGVRSRLVRADGAGVRTVLVFPKNVSVSSTEVGGVPIITAVNYVTGAVSRYTFEGKPYNPKSSYAAVTKVKNGSISVSKHRNPDGTYRFKVTYSGKSGTRTLMSKSAVKSCGAAVTEKAVAVTTPTAAVVFSPVTGTMKALPRGYSDVSYAGDTDGSAVFALTAKNVTHYYDVTAARTDAPQKPAPSRDDKLKSVKAPEDVSLYTFANGRVYGIKKTDEGYTLYTFKS